MPLILLGFDGFFTRFHEVFFEGDSWRFSTTDTLIRIYPEQFWGDVSTIAAVLTVGQALCSRRSPGGGAAAPVGARGDRARRVDGERPPDRAPGRGAHRAREHVRAFRAAVDHGVDLVEFDVLDLPRGPLVLAHSDHLDEVSHGAATGSVRARTLDELREVAPELPTLDEALAFFADEAPDVGLHVDLKLTTRLDELARRSQRHGLERRTVVSSFHVPSLQAVAREAPTVRIGFTYPEDRFGVSRRPLL